MGMSVTGLVILLFFVGWWGFCWIYGTVTQMIEENFKWNEEYIFHGLILLWFIVPCISICINIYAASKLGVLETDKRYEVIQVLQKSDRRTVYCIDEKGETITGPLYDICYDENTEIMYADEVSERYGISNIAKKLGLIEEKENYFRIYTNDKSYVEEQSIYYKVDRNENM